MGLKDINSLAHRKWNCKSHIDTVGKNRSRIGKYIRNQLKEDQLGEQLVMSEVGLLRAASNNPCTVGRPYYTFDVSARNRGL